MRETCNKSRRVDFACHERVKKVTASELHRRPRYRRGEVNKILLVKIRRQKEKYVVDKAWLDSLVRECESVWATLEILADRKLSERLLTLAKTIDEDVRHGRQCCLEGFAKFVNRTVTALDVKFTLNGLKDVQRLAGSIKKKLKKTIDTKRSLDQTGTAPHYALSS
jgi:hypothetical protein